MQGYAREPVVNPSVQTGPDVKKAHQGLLDDLHSRAHIPTA